MRIRIPEGVSYEQQYTYYMNVFKECYSLVKEGRTPIVSNVPWCWVPLFWYIGAEVNEEVLYFEHDALFKLLINCNGINKVVVRNDRTLIEFLCTIRPELSHTLRLLSSDWGVDREAHVFRDEFIMTTNASYYRLEVLDYMNVLHSFIPKKRKCVLITCTADKPYPAPVHQAVLKFLPEDYHLIVVTGALGLVPQELWSVSPKYDTTVPNKWNVMAEVKLYFEKFDYDKIVSYLDVYTDAVEHGLIHNDAPSIVHVNPVSKDYLNLVVPEKLNKLKEVL